jgi:hypothetical protein
MGERTARRCPLVYSREIRNGRNTRRAAPLAEYPESDEFILLIVIRRPGGRAPPSDELPLVHHRLTLMPRAEYSN